MSFFPMARTIFKTLLHGPYTFRYPFGPRREFYENSRGRIVNDIKECIFCGLCRIKCPAAALSVDKEGKVWEIDRLRCISCGYCVEVCPKKCIKMDNEYTPPLTKRDKEVYRNA